MAKGTDNPAGSTTFLRRLPRSDHVGRGLRRVLWLVAGTVAIYVLVLGEGGWLQVGRLRAEVGELEADLAWVGAKQAELAAELEALQESGGLALERVARERYGMRRPGEKVLHVLGSADESLTPQAPQLEPGDAEH